jgi:hypothetical protein
MIAKLDNCNNNESRHRWSKQKIHRSSFPRKVTYATKIGPAYYTWNQADPPCRSLTMS